MRKLTATLCLTLAVLLGSVGMSADADFQKGLTAYESGDYTTAVREWKPLAKQGHALSQGKLSVIYALGKGVIKDLVYAHMWGNIAATNGNKLGAKVRYSVAKKMTPSQIEEAKNFSVNVSVRNTKGVEL